MSQHHRDYQKTALYRWEDEYIRPRSKRVIERKDAQTFIDGVFLCERLLYPPKVEPMPKQATTILATGNRHVIQLPEALPAWVIVHELAHTLTSEVEHNFEGHGPDYVGIYIKMLDKYCDIPLALSMFTLTKTKVRYNLGAQPRFVSV